MSSGTPRARADDAQVTRILRENARPLERLVAAYARSDADRADRVVATTGKNPAVVHERKERENRLLAAVRALPVPHRQVITLLLEGLSHHEIADVLGTTENNIAVRANRARAAMRVLIEEGASS